MADDFRLFNEAVNTKNSNELQRQLQLKEKQLRMALEETPFPDAAQEKKRQEDISALKAEIEEIKQKLTSGNSEQTNSIVGDSTYKQLKQYAKSLKTGEEIETFRQQLINQIQSKGIPISMTNGEYTVPKQYKNDPHYKVLSEFTKDRLFGDSKWQNAENKTNKQNAKMYDEIAGNPLMEQAAINKVSGGTSSGAAGLGQSAAKAMIAMCLAIDNGNLAGFNQQLGILEQLLNKIESEVVGNQNATILYSYNLFSSLAKATPGKIITPEIINAASEKANKMKYKVEVASNHMQ